MSKYFSLLLVMVGLVMGQSGAAGAEEPIVNINIPFNTKSWTLTRADDGACILSAGKAGIEIRIAQGETTIYSTRTMAHGKRLEVRVGGHSYKTIERNFSQSAASGIIENFKVSDKAYLEWSEPSGRGSRMLRSTDAIDMEGFNDLLAQCR